jgi:hypothetical protein
MTFRRVAIVILCLLVSSTAGAQAVARDRRPVAPQPVGTGALGGRVVSAEGSPVRRAQIQLTSSDAGVRKAATSDNDGRYSFSELPAGRYVIRASKGGFVTFAFGQKAINQPVPPVILGNGESLSGLNIVLPRGSAVTGRVTDEFGDPILQAQVQAMRLQYQADGERRLMPAGANAMTDDLGQFRLFGLAPGEYVIGASTRPQFAPPLPNVQQAEPEEGYAPTFYPGTTNPTEAQPMTVGLGQELTVHIQLVSSRLARISGVIVDSQGRPAGPGTPIMFRQAATVGGMITRPANVAPDGVFTISGVPPGDYVLEVRPRPGPMDAGNGQSNNSEFAFMPISVGGSDITGLRIVTSGGATLSGRVVFEGTPPPAGTRVRVVPQAADPSRTNIEPVRRNNAEMGLVGADGSFQIDGIAGPFFLRITIDAGRAGTASDPLRYMTRAVLIDGADVADVPFDPTRRGSVSGITVVVTDKVTQVSGVVTDARGTPADASAVLIVPEQLPAGISPTRYVRMLQSDGNGKFSVRAMPAGRYAAVALATLDPAHQFDPGVIERARQIGKTFTLREGETVSLDLQVSGDF